MTKQKLILVGMALLSGCASQPVLPSATLTPEIAGVAEAAQRTTLIDPESARFYQMRAYWKETDLLEVCYLLNAKNRMGGYGGPAPYAVYIRVTRGADGKETYTAAGFENVRVPLGCPLS